MMEHFEKNPEKLKEQSQSKENPTRHFYPGGSSSRSQEDVQQNLSSASKDADVPSVSAQPSRIGLKDRLSDPIRRLYTNLHAYFWQNPPYTPMMQKNIIFTRYQSMKSLLENFTECSLRWSF